MNEATPLVRHDDAAPEDPAGRPRLLRRVTGVASPREVSRAELLAQGQSSEEADRALVRQNQARLMNEVAAPLLGLWALGTVICGLVTFVLLIILIVRWIQYNNLEASSAGAKTCDDNLEFWIALTLGFHIYRVWENWNDGEEPNHAKNIAFAIFDFGWKIVGLVWAYGAPKCAEYHPEYFAAFVHYVWFSLFTMVFVYGGLVPIVSVLLAVGAMEYNEAAPEGTVEQCEWIAFNERFNGEVFPKSCPVCMEDFDAERSIRQTPCQHVFHEDCLREWLGRARSCPLCRENIAKAVEVQTGADAV